MTLDAKIEAILFFRAEPVTVRWLAKFLEKKPAEVEAALDELETKLSGGAGVAGETGRGVVLVRKDDEVMLGTAPECSSLIEQITREELTRTLGKAGLETLSIILYRGPISRREIDYIRGVNSTFILRNLLVRGLVEKIQSPTDQRAFLYRPTFELLGFMGMKRIDELPEYAALRAEIEQFEKTAKEELPKEESEQSAIIEKTPDRS